MGRVNYRVVTLFASLASSILSAVSLAFLVTSLVSFRADDFLFASKTEDFTTLGTCIETLTDDQLVEMRYTDPDLKCEDNRERGNRMNVRNTLSVSVHSVIYAYYKDADFSASLSGAVTGEYRFSRVVGAMLTHVVGGDDGAGTLNVPVGINFTTAALVLREVSKVKVPVSCDAIYGKTFDTDIDDNSRFTDSAMEQYIKDIREGRYNDDEETKETWPLADLIVDCDQEAGSPGEGVLQIPGVPGAGGFGALPAATVSKLHAHCTAQFQFASVGTTPWMGTYGIPLPGVEPGPTYTPYPQADGFNATSSYNMRTRMYLGQRFGFSVWAYVPMFLATCFLLADSVVFFVAEAIMPLTLADTKKYSTSALNQARDSLVIAATTKSSRKKRLALGFFAVFASFLFYGIFIAGPWGFLYTILARPYCEKNQDLTGAGPDHGVPQIGWKGTTGGWKSDYDATWYDLAALATQLFVLILLPLTTTEFCRKWNSALSATGDERAVKAAISDQAQIVANTSKYRFHQKVFVGILGLAILIILVGQSISGARFGMAWAEGVVGQDWNEDKTGWMFDEIALSEAVYDQTVATMALVVACGLVFAVALQRHLINGVGCYSAALFFGWVGLVCIFALPITIYAAQRSIFNEKAASKDCANFPRDSHEFENDLCVSRFWTLLVGGAIFVGTLLLITGIGLAEALPALLKTRKRAAVFMKANAPPSQVFRASTPGMTQQAGYRSESEPFFNYQSKPIQSANTLLYAPHVQMKMPPR